MLTSVMKTSFKKTHVTDVCADTSNSAKPAQLRDLSSSVNVLIFVKFVFNKISLLDLPIYC